MEASESFTSVEPSPEDVRAARSASSRLARLEAGEAASICVGTGDGGTEVELPRGAVRMLGIILNEFARGHTVVLTRVETEVSTQRAAEILKVSRPYLVGLLEAGEIPFRRVGTHRRVLLAHVLTYRTRMKARTAHALDELAAQAQELGLYE